jgi:hypothetical protein
MLKMMHGEEIVSVEVKLNTEQTMGTVLTAIY